MLAPLLAHNRSDAAAGRLKNAETQAVHDGSIINLISEWAFVSGKLSNTLMIEAVVSSFKGIITIFHI